MRLIFPVTQCMRPCHTQCTGRQCDMSAAADALPPAGLAQKPFTAAVLTTKPGYRQLVDWKISIFLYCTNKSSYQKKTNTNIMRFHRTTATETGRHYDNMLFVYVFARMYSSMHKNCTV